MKILATSMSNLEFLFNFEDIVKNKINPVDYRYKIIKVDKLFDRYRLYLTVKDTKDMQNYKIVLDDFYVTKNPFLSNNTLQNLMNTKYFKSSHLDTSYFTRYKKDLKTKILEQLIRIKKREEKNEKSYELKLIIDAMLQSIKIKKADFSKKFRGKNLNSLISFVKTKEFLELLSKSNKVVKLQEGLYNISSFDRILEKLSNQIQQEAKYLNYPTFEKKLELFLTDKNSVDYMIKMHDIKNFDDNIKL